MEETYLLSCLDEVLGQGEESVFLQFLSDSFRGSQVSILLS